MKSDAMLELPAARNVAWPTILNIDVSEGVVSQARPDQYMLTEHRNRGEQDCRPSQAAAAATSAHAQVAWSARSLALLARACVRSALYGTTRSACACRLGSKLMLTFEWHCTPEGRVAQGHVAGPEVDIWLDVRVQRRQQRLFAGPERSREARDNCVALDRR